MNAPNEDEIGKELIARWNAGDQTAFKGLFQLHAKDIRKMVSSILRTKDRNLVDDVSQDVWVRVIGQARNYVPVEGASLRTWLMAIARSVSFNRLLVEKRRLGLPPRPLELPPAETLSPLDQAARQADIEKALLEIPVVEARVFRMVHMKGRSYTTIEKMTGIPASTLKARMDRACERLRTKLARWAPEGTRDEEQTT